MKKALLIALFAAMPIMAQECPKMPCFAGPKPCCKKMQRPQLSEEKKAEMKAKFMEKFDADKDGQLSDAEKEAAKAEMKAKFEARRAEMKAKFMEKFDADKDGQLSDAEKEAAKAQFQKRGPKGPRCGKKGPRRPHGPRPQLSEEQKAEMKAKFEARRAEMKAKFMEKFDADKDGQLSDAEKEAAKAEFKKNAPKFQKRGQKGPRRGCKCCK